MRKALVFDFIVVAMCFWLRAGPRTWIAGVNVGFGF